MADYRVLSQDEQDGIIVSFLLAQERDKFCHEINLARYTEMLKALPEGEWKDQVAKLRADTASRLAEVDSIITATTPQLPPEERITAAIARIKAKPTIVER